MNINLKYKNKKFSVDVKKCRGIRKGLGLTFTFRSKAEALLFEFNKKSKISLTSLFVFFPFIALWIDDKNKIVDLKIVKPFIPIINSKKSFTKIVEIPMNDKYRSVIRLFCS